MCAREDVEIHQAYSGKEKEHVYDKKDNMQTFMISEAICSNFAELEPFYRPLVFHIVKNSSSLEEIKSKLEEAIEQTEKTLGPSAVDLVKKEFLANVDYNQIEKDLAAVTN